MSARPLGFLVMARSGDLVSFISTLPVSLGDLGFGTGVGEAVERRLLAAVPSVGSRFAAGDSGRRLFATGDSGRRLFTAGGSGRRLSRWISRAVSRYRDSGEGKRSLAV